VLVSYHRRRRGHDERRGDRRGRYEDEEEYEEEYEYDYDDDAERDDYEYDTYWYEPGSTVLSVTVRT
jgi:hypothetical protein